jgi:hypothetical protein
VADLSRSFAVESNDMMLVLYLASLIRSLLALHDLIDNKSQRMMFDKQRVGGWVGAVRWVGGWLGAAGAGVVIVAVGWGDVGETCEKG